MSSAAYVIKNQLCRVGNTARLADGDYLSMPFFCTLQQTWRKNKTNFEKSHTPLGLVSTDYYMYIGPFDSDITALSDSGELVIQGERFEFLKKEAVLMGDDVLYYTGVVKKIVEGSNAENK